MNSGTFISTTAGRYERTLWAKVALRAFQRPCPQPSARDAIAIINNTRYAGSYSVLVQVRGRKEWGKGMRAVIASGEEMGKVSKVAAESRRDLRLEYVARAETSDERSKTAGQPTLT